MIVLLLWSGANATHHGDMSKGSQWQQTVKERNTCDKHHYSTVQYMVGHNTLIGCSVNKII